MCDCEQICRLGNEESRMAVVPPRDADLYFSPEGRLMLVFYMPDGTVAFADSKDVNPGEAN